MLRPQAFGYEWTKVTQRYGWFRRGLQWLGIIEPPATVKHTCAWGAAIEAAGDDIKFVQGAAPLGSLMNARGPATVTGGFFQVPSEWAMIWQEVACPVCEGKWPGLKLIAHLNDVHRWTREVIADFVEEIELRSANAVEPQTVAKLPESVNV